MPMRNIEYELQGEDEGYMAVRRGCFHSFLPQRPGSISTRSSGSITVHHPRSEVAILRGAGSVNSYDEYVVHKSSRSTGSKNHNESFITTKTENSSDTRRTSQSNKSNILFRIRAEEDKSTRSSTANESVDLEFDDDNSFSMASQMGLLKSESSTSSFAYGGDNMNINSVSVSPYNTKVSKHRRHKSNGSLSSLSKKASNAPFASMPIPLDDLLEDDVTEDIIPSSSISLSPQGKFHAFKACVPTKKKRNTIPKYTPPNNSSTSHLPPKVQYGSSVVVENDYTQILFQPNYQENEIGHGIQVDHRQNGFTESAAKNWKGTSASRSEELHSDMNPDDVFLQTLAKALSNNYDQLQADLRKLTGNTELQRLVSESKNPDVPQILDLSNIEDQSDLVSEFGMGSTSGGRYNDHASVVHVMEREYRHRADYGPSRRSHSFRMTADAMQERFGATGKDGDDISYRRPTYDQTSFARSNTHNLNRYAISTPLSSLKEEAYILGESGVHKTPLTLAEAFDDFGTDDVMYCETMRPNSTYDFSLDDEEEPDYIFKRQPAPLRSMHNSRARTVPNDNAFLGRQPTAISNWREERRAQMLKSNSEHIATSTSKPIVPSADRFNRSQKYADRVFNSNHAPRR